MSNRKENYKKTLGLTEYPWSSEDDEETPDIVSGSTSAHLSNETDQHSSARTSGQTQSLSPNLSSVRKNTSRLERDLFWSLLHNPSYRRPASDPARPGPSSYQAESNDLPDLDSSMSNIDRIFALSKMSRRVDGMNYRTNHTRDILSLLPDLPGNVKLSAIKKRPPNTYLGSRVGRQRTSTPEASSHRSTPHDIDSATNSAPFDDEVDNTLRRTASPAGAEPDQSTDNATAEPQLEHPVTEDAVVEIEADVEVVHTEDSGVDNAQAQASEQPAEEPGASNGNGETQQQQALKRKRGENDENDINSVKEFNQSVLRLLECPVCMEWMEPPMSQCRRGHLVCGPCRVRLAACPVCRTAFSSVRNRAMEAVAELLRYPCRHGCGREARLRRRAAHEASCSARRYCCPVPPCSMHALYPLDELHYHFQAKHLSILKVGRKHKFSMRVNAEQHDNWLVLAARELFHLRVDVDVRTWGFVVYVAYIGPRCNAKNFTYEVTVTGQHNNRKLVYARATHSDLESSSLNVSRQDCFHLTLDQALNFLRLKNRHCEPDKYLDFMVEINKREEPPEVPLENSDS